MTDGMPYTIGTPVTCDDGDCGELVRVIIDPVAHVLRHLVVGPGPDGTPARLVPVSLVASAGTDGIRLICDTARFALLDAAESTEFLTATRDELGYRSDHISWLPYYPLGPVGPLMPPELVTSDRVPRGEVQVRRGDAVHALDGDIGRVQGLVVDAEADQVTHVLLAEGHLWGKKDVAVPIKAVTEVTGLGIYLNLTKEQVKDLPAIEIGAIG